MIYIKRAIIENWFKTAWRNYTWFSMVAMNGDDGERRFEQLMSEGRI